MNKAVPAVALLFVYLEAAYDLPVSVLTINSLILILPCKTFIITVKFI